MTQMRVGGAALILGYAGLLPPLATVGALAVARLFPTDPSWVVAAVASWITLIYAGVILSFLGGVWWGFAMRRERGQSSLAAIAILPSLIAAALIGLACLMFGQAPFPVWPSVGMGVAILLTLPIDRRLARLADAPENWMLLRAPLSIGLGGLTIAAGLLVRV